MSIKKWPGAVVSDTPVEPAGPYQDSAASGVWTLEQQAYWEAQGLWPVPGNPNPDLFIENLFSTYLYTGNDSTQTITNGIDLDSEGGMVWVKSRDQAGNPTIIDTDRGVNKNLPTNQTYTEDSDPSISSFNSNGFSINSLYGFINDTGINYASWTFRKAPKFFDVVTYTGNFTAGREIAHNLGSVPGMIIIKSLTDDGYPWRVYHQSLGPTKFLALNSTNGEGDAVSANMWNSTAPTDSVFTLGNHITVNSSSPSTYVAYLFAHDAGGFGDDAEQNVISCGSFVAPSSGTVSVTLGYEPQWILFKSATSSDNWFIFDTMRGWTASGNAPALSPNLSNDESPKSDWLSINSTGFTMPTGIFASSDNIIYIAIRRGPMKTPESGTEVFAVNTTSPAVMTAGFPVDAVLSKYNVSNWSLIPRLTVGSLSTSTASTEVNYSAYASFASNTAFLNNGAENPAAANWMFKRAPGFFDVVAYTGNVVAGRQIPHNLGVAPELMIAKTRDAANYWVTYDAASGPTKFMILNTYNETQTTIDNWNNTAPTASVFTVGGGNYTNRNATQQIIYLFASCPGVSKVGSYTGTGADLNVDCGFSAGARFILIKRTDTQINVAPTTGWYVWDSARGIASGNDPYLLLNSAAAENTSTDYIDPLSSGFTVTSSAPAALNASGGTYIFLAIA
jgi:hypothetical protein